MHVTCHTGRSISAPAGVARPAIQGQLETALAASDQEISCLRGQLETILADSDRQMNALKDQLKAAAADSDRRLSVMKGELETAQAECAKASQVEGRLDTRPSRTAGMPISRGSQPSRLGVLLRYAHPQQPSPSLTWQSTSCVSLSQVVHNVVGDILQSLHTSWYVAKLPWGI